MSDWRTISDEKEKYAAYLCSREWSELREAVRKRSNGKCERCRLFGMDQVHHLSYARKYAEALDDLQAICEACHKFTHGKSDFDPLTLPPPFDHEFQTRLLVTLWSNEGFYKAIRESLGL